MPQEHTLTIIKPHAVRDQKAGSILAILNDAGFRIAAMKMVRLSTRQTEEFYKEHNEKYFYKPLIEMMSSGPVILVILEKENAISDLRQLIGSTDPENAHPGTIRNLFGLSMRENAIHASDSYEKAVSECAFFFSNLERY